MNWPKPKSSNSYLDSEQTKTYLENEDKKVPLSVGIHAPKAAN